MGNALTIASELIDTYGDEALSKAIAVKEAAIRTGESERTIKLWISIARIIEASL